MTSAPPQFDKPESDNPSTELNRHTYPKGLWTCPYLVHGIIQASYYLPTQSRLMSGFLSMRPTLISCGSMTGSILVLLAVRGRLVALVAQLPLFDI